MSALECFHCGGDHPSRTCAIAQARVGALRKAAADWQQGEWAEFIPALRTGNPIAAAQCFTDWLRQRADSIVRDDA